MQRGAILIGVSKAGSLDRLQAVESGISAMRLWAQNQRSHGMNLDYVKVITDAEGPVTASNVKRVVRDLVNLKVLDQLVVYFAGHGVNIGYSEYWLLSGAPEDTGEAINVDGSLVLARQCRIPHIVMLSDACRTAAEGIQATRVTGSELFPNLREGGLEQSVDVFFATSLGRPALEVRDPKEAAKGYRSAYTESLIEPLEGRRPELLESHPVDGTLKLALRPWPLKRYLGDAISARMAVANVDFDKWAPPDARINSPPDSWISLHESVTPAVVATPPPAPARGVALGPVPVIGRQPSKSPSLETAPATIQSVSQERLRAVLSSVPRRLHTIESARGSGAAQATTRAHSALNNSISRIATPFGPASFEADSGFKVQGAFFAGAFSVDAHVDVGNEHDIVRASFATGPAANVLLTLNSGHGMVLPVIRGYVAAITIDDGEVTNVTYEPSDNSILLRRFELQDQLARLRELRAVIAAAARFGAFRIDRSDALDLAQQMRELKAIDPALALYAAYAFHDLQRPDLIRDMQDYLWRDLQLTLFDVAMLARDLDGVDAREKKRVYPHLPLLSQGWALLSALEIKTPQSIDKLRGHLVSSLWTLYDKEGVVVLRSAFQSQEIR